MSLTDSRCVPVEEMIHGVLVSDPYRWLEDRSLPETEEWISEQQRRCDEYFARCEDIPAIRERVRDYLDVDVVDQPARVGDRYFFRRRLRGQEQGCLYVRDPITDMERLLVDPSIEGNFVSVGIHRISNDGSLLAYERKLGGEDKKSIHIVDVETGAVLPFCIESGYARGFVFTADNRGFYYCQDLSTNVEEHTIRHKLLDDSAAEQIVFRVVSSRGSRLIVSADLVHLGAIWVYEVDGEMFEDFWVAQSSDPTIWHQVIASKRLPFVPILKDGRFFAITYEDADSGQLVELNWSGEETRMIVPGGKTKSGQLTMAGERVFVLFQDGLASHVSCWSLRGEELLGIDLPPMGTARLLPDLGDGTSIFLSYESFTRPPTLFEYIPELHVLKTWDESSLLDALTPCSIWRAAYSSADGVRIPITIVSKHAQHDADTPAPLIMTSYGGFGVPMTPRFSILVSIFLERGVIFALPHIRGGGEFGKAWHEAGRGRNRQASFDDFLAAAQWLCDQKITTPEKLAIFGGSNSGLLVGAAMTQRPELFRAVLSIAPLLDMVRYECFDQAVKWRREYGSAEDCEGFLTLYAYSPYHRVRDDVDYPAVFFVSGDKDDRCNPAHVRKMAARLLEREAQVRPIVVDYSEYRGHSAVLPLSVRIEALVRRIVFLCRELNLPIHEGGHDDMAGA